MSDIRFDCPHCQHHLIVDEQGAGRQVPCPSCGTAITIPSPAKPPPDSEEQHATLQKDRPPTLQPTPSSGLGGLHIKSKDAGDGEAHGEDINVDQPFSKKKDQWFTNNHGKKYHFCYYNSHGRMMETACDGEHMDITAEIAADLAKPRKGAYCKDCLKALDINVNDLL